MPVNKSKMKAMKEQYGSEKGEQVYYAMENKEKKYGSGSMMEKPTDRSNYAEGGYSGSIPSELINHLNKFAPKGEEYVRTIGLDENGNEIEGLTLRPSKNIKYAYPAPPRVSRMSTREAFDKAFAKARSAGKSEFIFMGKPFHTKTAEEMVQKYAGGKMKYNEGSMLVPPEMEQMEMPSDDTAPVDTYPNIPPEEMDEAMASQLPDEEMMQEYIDFVVDESLEDEEKDYLMNALSQDPQLSQIFDKVVETASEFSGSGFVDGPGSGVSDSIPARLSAGEFVITKKATDQIGPENLQKMMDDAERAYDGGLMSRQTMDTTSYDTISDEEIRKQMLDANRMPSVR